MYKARDLILGSLKGWLETLAVLITCFPSHPKAVTKCGVGCNVEVLPIVKGNHLRWSLRCQNSGIVSVS